MADFGDTGSLAEAGVVITAVDQFSETTGTYIAQQRLLRQSENETAAANRAAGESATQAAEGFNMGSRSMARYAMAGLVLSGSMSDLGIKTGQLRLALMLFFTAAMMGFNAVSAGVVVIGALAAVIVKAATYSKNMKESFESSADALVKATEKTGAHTEAQKALLRSYEALMIAERAQTMQEIQDLEAKGVTMSAWAKVVEGLKIAWLEFYSIASTGKKADLSGTIDQAQKDAVLAYQTAWTNLQVQMEKSNETIKEIEIALNGGTDAMDAAKHSAEEYKKQLDQTKASVEQMSSTLSTLRADALDKSAESMMKNAQTSAEMAVAEQSAAEALKEAVRERSEAIEGEMNKKIEAINAQVAKTAWGQQLEAQYREEGALKIQALDDDLTQKLIDNRAVVTKKAEEEAKKEAEVYKKLEEDIIRIGKDAEKKQQEHWKKIADITATYSEMIGDAIGQTAAGNTGAWKAMASDMILTTAHLINKEIELWLAGELAKGHFWAIPMAAAGIATVDAIASAQAAEITRDNSSGQQSGTPNYGSGTINGSGGYTNPGYSGGPGYSYTEGAFAPTLNVTVPSGRDVPQALRSGQQFLDQELPEWLKRQRSKGARTS